MKRVYFASKLSEAPVWRDICAKSHEIIAHARWLKHNKLGTPDTPDKAVRFWIEDEEDIVSADAVVVYAKEGQHLRGALIEAGIAIAIRKPLYVVGDHPDYGTWRWHPAVKIVATIEDAIKQIAELP